MNRKTIALLLIMSAGLAGCATVWDKPGLNAGDFRRDHSECRRESNQTPFNPLAPWDTYLQREQIMDRCMEARGYTKQ